MSAFTFAQGRSGTLESLVLLPALGTTTDVWTEVASYVHATFPSLRIIGVDLPGHGVSRPAPQSFTMADLASSVLQLVDDHESIHLAGVSIGGEIALELAITQADRVQSLALLGTGSRIGDRASWIGRATRVRSAGTRSVAELSAGRWFAPGYLDQPVGVAGRRSLELLLAVDDESYANGAQVLADFDRTSDLGAVHLPTLVVVGENDVVTSPAQMAAFAAGIRGATLHVVSNASHLAVQEQPKAIAGLLVAHLAETGFETRSGTRKYEGSRAFSVESSPRYVFSQKQHRPARRGRDE